MAEYIFLAVVLVAALYLFWTQKVRPDMTAVMVMLSLVIPWPRPDGTWRAILEPAEGFAGFGSAAVLMIAGMFILGRAIVRTGAAEALGLRLLRAAADREWLLQLTVLLMATASSTIINDTTVVLIFLPLIMGICKEKGLSPSRYLLFAAYGSLLGGQWTLIGTRSNIIISDFLRLHNGEGIGFFEFTPVASAVFAVSAVFLMLVGRRFLPEAIPPLSRDVMKEFLTEVDVPAGSSAIDHRLEEVSPFANEGVAVAALLRKGHRMPLYTRLLAGDVIIVRGTVDHIGSLIKSSDFRVVEESKLDQKALQSADLVTVEAVLPSSSTYVGRPLNRIPIRRAYGLTVVGLARHGRPVETRIMSTTLEAGDSILFLGGAEEIARLRENPGLIVLEDQPFTAIGRRKAWTIAFLL
ncbi:MAG: SLC13 family permease, partial [Gemmatimonadales bacterium]